MKGRYVVFDGMEGSGKDTQIDILKKKLSGPEFVFTREPGGSAYAERIRELLLSDLSARSTALTHFLLFWAAREDTLEHVVMPALNAGKTVFSNRGDSSTYVYQLWGEDQKWLIRMFGLMRHLIFSGERKRKEPDLYIVFDLPPETARERATRDKSRVQTHYDAKPLEYYKRVSDGFRKFAETYPVRFIDASGSIEEVQRRLCMVLVSEGITPGLLWEVA